MHLLLLLLLLLLSLLLLFYYYYYYYKDASSFSSDRQNLSPRLNLTSPFSYKGKNINVTSGETTFQQSTERFCSLLIEASM